jgi:hypothetical protein
MGRGSNSLGGKEGVGFKNYDEMMRFFKWKI